MSDTKKKLIEEINRKAKRIAEKRSEANSNKTVEAYVFEFFRQVDDANQQVDEVKRTFIAYSIDSLQSKIRNIDNRAKIDIVWLSDEKKVQGVTIMWSPQYIKVHNVDPTLYIDVSQMLFC